MAVEQNMGIMKAGVHLKRLYVVQEFGQDMTLTREMGMEMEWCKTYIRELTCKELDNQLTVMVKERQL